MSLTSLVSESLHLLWPARCAACDRHIPEEALFCAACNLAINPMPLHGVCPGCALPREVDPQMVMFEGKRCRRCLRVPLPFASAAAGFEYGETIAHAIVRMKHGGRRDLAQRLARLLVPPLAETLAQARIGSTGVVVPVPLHASRLRQRGFNQSVELARWALIGLSRAPQLRPSGGVPRLERSLLHRARATRELGRSGPAARLSEVAGAFVVSDTARVRGRRVLLIDDVYTTGATFSECSNALLAAGAAAVHALALARAV